MFNGPDQEPDDTADGFQASTEYSNSKSGASSFAYNPAASDITTQSGDFAQPTDVEAPEKD